MFNWSKGPRPSTGARVLGQLDPLSQPAEGITSRSVTRSELLGNGDLQKRRSQGALEH